MNLSNVLSIYSFPAMYLGVAMGKMVVVSFNSELDLETV